MSIPESDAHLKVHLLVFRLLLSNVLQEYGDIRGDVSLPVDVAVPALSLIHI